MTTPELVWRGIRNINDAVPFCTPIHAEIIMDANKSFAAGEISVKGFYYVQREGAVVLHEVIFDAVLDATPIGRIAIQLVTAPVSYNSLPIYRILGPATVYFVFCRNDEEVARCGFDVDLKFDAPIVAGQPLPNILRYLNKNP